MFVEHWPSYQEPLSIHAAAVGAGWPKVGTLNSRRSLVAEISVVLVMLVAVVLSQAITLVLPFAVPLPLVQIALGALLAAVMDVGVPLNPDIFFLLFIPPLLFLDGWRIPNRGLFKDAGTILELALGLGRSHGRL